MASHQAVLVLHGEPFSSFSVTKSCLILFLIGGLKSGAFCLASDAQRKFYSLKEDSPEGTR